MPLPSDALAIGRLLHLLAHATWWPTRLEDRPTEAVLTLAWPTDISRRLVPLETDDPVSVWLAAIGDAMYVADGRIHATQDGDVPLIGIELTGDWARAQRRNAYRASVALMPRLAQIVYGGTARRPVRLGVTDVSATGVQVRSQDELRPGDLLQLAFDLEGEIDLYARVRRVQRRDRTWEAGCAFEAIPERVAEHIIHAVFTHQRAALRASRGSR